ncbi:GtrA family protein [Brevibacterium sp. Re57]|uniref:GtrA family protein n=2 Tax=Brevibacteriaceae TaxID=85019 RepID=A0ABR8WWD0_9MICO|nr:GtrA family protein [Brevibacterium gallinarum]
MPVNATSVPVSRWRTLIVEVFRFLSVGGVAYIVDVGVSNLLVYGFFGIPALMPGSPLKAKIISTVLSIIVAWLGNKLWTYGDRDSGSNVRGFVMFVVVNAIGMVIAVAPLGFTWYVLGLRDPVSYNLSTNVIGIGLAMVFRFYAYRTWVFKEISETEVVVPMEDDDVAASRKR